MVNIKQALDVALVRKRMRIHQLSAQIGYSDTMVRLIAQGKRGNDTIRSFLEEFCKEHAPEDYARCMGEGNKTAAPHANKLVSPNETNGAQRKPFKKEVA